MVYFNLVTVAVVLNAVAISVLAYPDPANWGKCTTQRYSGIEWEPARDIVYQHLSNACSGWSGHRGAYQELYFKPWNQSPYSAKVCVNTDTDSHINMEIANMNPNTGFTLQSKDCIKEFSWILLNYDNGGEKQCNGWYFRLDPNRGQC